MNFNFSNSQIKISFLVLIAVVVSVVILGGISIQTIRSALNEQALSQLVSVREIKKKQIEKSYEERKADLAVLIETTSTLRKEAFNKLIAIREIKKKQLEDYFSQQVKDISALTESRDIDHTFQVVKQYHIETKVSPTGPYNVNTNAYKKIYKDNSTYLNNFVKTFGYKDVFIICTAHGHVMYTAAKKSDLGTNLRTGPYSDSNLADLRKKVIKEKKVVVQDFRPYAPNNNEPAAFIGAPYYDEIGVMQGVIALQISIDQINGIMWERSGLAETSETYLVGEDHLMRSDSYLDPSDHSVFASFSNPDRGKIETEAALAALKGKSEAKVTQNYNNQIVLSAYTPVKYANLTWAFIADIDISEAFNPKNENGKEFFAQYRELYGYHDVFLINPDGYIFYTAAKEPDYQTNILNGKFASSSLGELVRRVSNTRQFGFADFKKYAPSNGEPAAFIAQPLIRNDKVELIIALQISIDGLNQIMQIRDGMGETGETYLVGQDKRMRSDSFLDPEGHSVKASFAGTIEKNGIDTIASAKALSGNKGVEVNTDYNNNPVLSAYTPVKFGSTTWGLIAEIDEAEVNKRPAALSQQILIIAIIISLVAIFITAVFIRFNLSKPLNKIITLIKELELDKRLHMRRRDEIGQIGDAVDAFISRIHQVILSVKKSSVDIFILSGQISEGNQDLSSRTEQQSASLEETASALEEMTANVDQNAENAKHADTISREMKGIVGNGNEHLQKAIAETIDSTQDRIQSVQKNNADFSIKVQETNDQTKAAMHEIEDRAETISGITTVMNDIAFQTNILALNASVEAARAGEHGKGFAVVAAEVRKLAHRSGNASKEISKLIKNSLSQINKGVQLVETSNEVVETMLSETDATLYQFKQESLKHLQDLKQQVEVNLDQITVAVTKVTDVIENISAASLEQAEGIRQINVAVNELDKITQQNATLADEVTSVSQSLASLSADLKSTVSVFKLTDTHTEIAESPTLISENKSLEIQNNTPERTISQPLLSVHSDVKSPEKNRYYDDEDQDEIIP